MNSLTSIGSIDQYVKEFSHSLAAKVASQAVPLHDPAKDKQHPRISQIKVKPFAKQADLVTACVKALDADRLAILACQMGTGKTCQAISTVHCHADGKPHNVLVLCPPHLTTKWRDEVRKFLGGTVRVTIIENWQQFVNLRYRDDNFPTWYIMAETTAKLGYTKRAAVVQRIKRVTVDHVTSIVNALCCPKCDYRALKRDKDRSPAGIEDIEKSWLKCIGMWCKTCGKSYHHDGEKCPVCENTLRRCDEPLWQGSQHKVAPAQYAKVKGIDWFDYLIRDEAHNSKSATSIDGHATAVFASLARYTLLLTGTLLAGKSEDLRPLLFRLKPRPFIEAGYGWNSEIDFAQSYGRIQTVVRESSGGTKRRTGKGSSKSTTQSVKPGIMPQLYPDFVANYTVFMSLPELATDLPAYYEDTVPVPMEGMMAECYTDMKEKLLAAFRSMYANNRKLAVKLLGPMLEALMTWPDVPFDRKPISITDEVGREIHIYLPVSLDKTVIYPKERELLRILAEEKKQGRKCWVYSVRDDVRDRLEQILESHGLKVAHLKASVKPSARLDWLAENAPHCDVGMCHPKLVETGIEMFGPGFNFPTLIWYSTGFQLNTLRQASRRSWRIGQKKGCRTIYLYYAESAQSTAIGVMASKLVAAEALEGKFSDGGLADESQDEDVAMAVARSLADNIQVAVQKRYRPIEASTEKDAWKLRAKAWVARKRAERGLV